MADFAERYADRRAAVLGKRIRRLYGDAAKDAQKKLEAFEKRHAAKDAMMRQKLKDGKISEAEYQRWEQGQVFIGKQWQQKLDDITKVYVDADKKAREIIHGENKNVFAEAANYTMFDIDKHTRGGFAFNLYDKNTVARLLKSDPKMLPAYKINETKDYVWNARRVRNSVMQGIVQGESVADIGKRLTSELAARNAQQMNLFARTAITGAQNAGRMDMLHNAQDMGIKVRKKWLATLDARTREVHAHLDGQEQDVDEPFKSELGDIMFPGDPNADPANTYGCRCTLTYVYPRFDKAKYNGERRDQETHELIKNQSYSEWKAQKERDAEIKRTRFDVTDEYSINATPGKGKITYDRNYKFDNSHKREPYIAEWIHATFGGDIQVLQEIDESEGKPYRDYIWRGRDWELKSTSSLGQVRKHLEKAATQIARNPGGIILDLDMDTLDLNEILEKADKVLSGTGYDSDLIILNKEKLVCIKRYKKNRPPARGR